MSTKMLRYFLCLFVFAKLSEAHVEIEAVTPRFLRAEEPHYDYENQRLIFVDRYGEKVCIYDLISEQTTSLDLGQTPGAIVPIANEKDKYLMGLGSQLVILEWNGVSPYSAEIITLDTVEEEARNTFNDGKADKQGRFWIGTSSLTADGEIVPHTANLYVYTEDRCSLKLEVEDITISNGIAWNREETEMYYIDSDSYKIHKFDYNKRNGKIRNRETVFDFREHGVGGFPDGMTIDTNNYLWIACHNGSKVIQINPKSGEILTTINIPVYAPTSLTWGGPELDILFITTAVYGHGEEERERQPMAGSVLAITGLKARGFRANKARVCRSNIEDQFDEHTYTYG